MDRNIPVSLLQTVLFSIICGTIFIAVYILILKSDANQLDPVKIEMMPLDPSQTNHFLFVYDTETVKRSSIEVDPQSHENKIHVHVQNPEIDSGFGIFMNAAVPENAFLYLKWRSEGKASMIHVDLMDTSSTIDPRVGGENFVYSILPPGPEWKTVSIPLFKFQQNTSQMDGVELDGYFQTGSIGRISFTIPRGSDLTLEIQKIEFVWGLDHSLLFSAFLLILITGVYLNFKRISMSGQTPGLKRTMSQYLSNRLIYGFITLAFLLCIESNSNQLNSVLLIAFGAFYLIVIADDLLHRRILESGIYTIRYAIILLLANGFGLTLPLLPFTIITFTTYLPAILCRNFIFIPIIFFFQLCTLFTPGIERLLNFSGLAYGQIFLFYFTQFILATLVRELIQHRLTRIESLRTSSLYHDLFEHTSDGIYTTDQEGGIRECNLGFLHLVGMPIEEVRGKNLYDFIPPEDHAALLEKRDSLGKDFTLCIEIHFTHSSGEVRTVLLRERVLYEERHITGYQGIATNISDRKTAEDALKMSESLYRKSIEIAGVVPYYQNYLENSYDFVGEGITAITGYFPWEFTPQLWNKIIQEQSLLGSMKGLNEEAAVEKFFTDKSCNWVAEYRITTKDGQERWVFNAAVPLEGKDGELSGSFGVLMDITERKQLEAVLRRQSLIFKYMHDGIILTDMEGKITDWNPASERILGYRKEEVLGQTSWTLLKNDPNGEPNTNFIVYKVMEEGFWNGIFTSSTKDGREVSTDVTIVPLCDDNGGMIGYFWVNHDISEKLKSESERGDLEEKLRQAQKMEALGRLAGGVAHDFNNILTAIRGYSDLLLRKIEPGSSASRDVEQICKASDRAANLTRQLLFFSRRQVVQSQVLNLNDLVHDMEKMLRRLISEDIELKTAYSSVECWVLADPGQIEMVLMNLVVNARDAMPNGGRIAVETSIDILSQNSVKDTPDLNPGSYVVLTVSDTGVGINAKILPQIFEPFFTTKPQGQGTGLGLSTVYGIISQCNGRIQVNSQIGMGTIFEIYLPLVSKKVTPGFTSASSPSETLTGSETILLVEDEFSVRALVHKILTTAGYQVIETSDSIDAIEIASQLDRIDLLLTDVVMPNMSGPELAQHMQQNHPEMKLLFMSGYTDDTILRHGILEKGVPFLQKPFSATALIQKVRATLDSEAVLELLTALPETEE